MSPEGLARPKVPKIINIAGFKGCSGYHIARIILLIGLPITAEPRPKKYCLSVQTYVFLCVSDVFAARGGGNAKHHNPTKWFTFARTYACVWILRYELLLYMCVCKNSSQLNIEVMVHQGKKVVLIRLVVLGGPLPLCLIDWIFWDAAINIYIYIEPL